MLDYNKGKGCHWVNCCVCDREFLVSDAVGVGHPDDAPSVLVCGVRRWSVNQR